MKKEDIIIEKIFERVSNFFKVNKKELPPYYASSVLFEEIIHLLNKNDYLNINEELIDVLSAEFKYEYSILKDNPEYKNLIDICTNFSDKNIDLGKSLRKKSISDIRSSLYHLNEKVSLEMAIRIGSISFFRFASNDSSKNKSLFSPLINEKEVFLDFCNKILYIDKKINFIELREKALESNEIINKKQDSISQILQNFKQTKKEVEIDTISSLVGKIEFLEMVIENKVLFYSKKEPILSRNLCKSLIELSNKKGYRKAGNTKAHLNTLLPANEFAKKIGPKLEKLEMKGFKTLQSKADELNDKEIKTLRGKKWTRSAVKSTYERWQKLKAEEEENSNKPKKTKQPKP